MSFQDHLSFDGKREQHLWHLVEPQKGLSRKLFLLQCHAKARSSAKASTEQEI